MSSSHQDWARGQVSLVACCVVARAESPVVENLLCLRKFSQSTRTVSDNATFQRVVYHVLIAEYPARITGVELIRM